MNRSVASLVVLAFATAVWWLVAVQAPMSVLVYGIGLCILAPILLTRRVTSWLLGARAPEMPEGVGPVGLVVTSVGLLGVDLHFISIVNEARNLVIAPSKGLELEREMLRLDWFALDVGHTLLFFFLLVLLGWIADANAAWRRLLQGIWFGALLVYACHLVGKLGDTARLISL